MIQTNKHNLLGLQKTYCCFVIKLLFLSSEKPYKMLGLGGRRNLKQVFLTDLSTRSFTMLKSSSHRLKAYED